MHDEPQWVSWVNAARAGDASARAELIAYFTPFVHGVLMCWVPSAHVDAQVLPALEEALVRCEGPASQFGAQLLEVVRGRAKAFAQGMPPELAAPALSRLRALAEPAREWLMLRLLEGISGPELAEVSAVPEARLRTDLERAAAVLVEQLGGQKLDLTGNAYLWGLAGAPHPALAPLENQLGVLRYTAGLDALGAVEVVDPTSEQPSPSSASATPFAGVKPLTAGSVGNATPFGGVRPLSAGSGSDASGLSGAKPLAATPFSGRAALESDDATEGRARPLAPELPPEPATEAMVPVVAASRPREGPTAPFSAVHDDPTRPRGTPLRAPAFDPLPRHADVAEPLPDTIAVSNLPAAAQAEFPELSPTAQATNLPAAAQGPYLPPPATVAAPNLPAAARVYVPLVDTSSQGGGATGFDSQTGTVDLRVRPSAGRAAPANPFGAQPHTVDQRRPSGAAPGLGGVQPLPQPRSAEPTPQLTRSDRQSKDFDDATAPRGVSVTRPPEPVDEPELTRTKAPTGARAAVSGGLEGVRPRGGPVPQGGDGRRGTPISMLYDAWQPPQTPAAPPQAQSGDETAPRVPQVAHPPVASSMRGALPFVMAAVLLVFGAAAAFAVVRNSEREIRKPWALVPVAVAAVNIPEGTTVTFDMISKRDVPEQFATISVVKPEQVNFITNQRIMVAVQAGDPLLWSEFESSMKAERLSTRVQKRARAYTIDAEDIVSVGGWLRPGDHVDLVVTLGQGTDDPQRIAATTLQNLIVLSTGKATPRVSLEQLKPQEQHYNNVSVLALPEEIEMLALTSARASYQLILRHPEDLDGSELHRTNASALLTGRALPSSLRLPPRPPVANGGLPESPQVRPTPWMNLTPEKGGDALPPWVRKRPAPSKPDR
ncbi:MAG: Flp pilus assembly protein CpaB [Archangiaceae bacterium]|nr:Flp pilus assembly protein CpaB [Archangiaceae bacterium]